MAYKIMVLGTASDVGKSIIATALCRHFYRQGLRVAPFKAQNMTLNTYVTEAGEEIGGSQAVQALAAGTVPRVEMNPVLLKPRGEMSSRVVLLGRDAGEYSAVQYRQEFIPRARTVIATSLETLDRDYDLLILEGAGSPVEINLKAGDIVNMAVAQQAQCPIILVADIDRGGVFAALVGTYELLEPEERRRLVGVIINKFRGDPQLFTDGIGFIEERLGVPVLGVLPYLPELGLPAEDSLSLANLTGKGSPTIHVLQLPFMSNFTDLDPLVEAGARIELVTGPKQLAAAQGIIIPGTENPGAALDWLEQRGLTGALRAAVPGAWLLAIAGGYQLAGEEFWDTGGRRRGLGLLPVQTAAGAKVVCWVQGRCMPRPLAGVEVKGYLVGQGLTTPGPQPFLCLEDGRLEGAVSSDCRLIGTDLHGVMTNPDFRRWWLSRGAVGGDLASDWNGGKKDLGQAADTLAAAFAASIDTKRLWELISKWQEPS